MEEAQSKDDAMPASTRAKALFVAGTMANGQGDARSAASQLEESLALFREFGDERGAGYALCSVGYSAVTGQERAGRGITLVAGATDLFPRGGGQVGRRLRAWFFGMGMVRLG